MVADLHAITTKQDPAALRERSLSFYAQYLACGLNPEKNIVFMQSHVSEHAELAWILSCFTSYGDLTRMTQFKDKSAKHPKNINAGLFTYPVLMAADILLYDAHLVPVGEDQKQHLEVTRDIAIKINELYGEVFKLPEPIIRDESAAIPGTDGAKMSKSYGNTIELFLEEAPLKKKIMGIQTDSTPVEAPKPTEGSAILGIYRHVASPSDYALMEEDFLLVKAAGHASSSMGVVDALNSVRAERNVGYSYLRDFFGIKVYGRLIIGISEQIYGD
jgi:tryptophanyl-tRNA synthetase